ncbi:MAG: hypothetical protein JNK04_22980, partial [Myxococcales bacterium]|nr:hypothetical protein [Myxococcales bacterium]
PEDSISRFVFNLRLRHICSALEWMVVGDEAHNSHFMGSLTKGGTFHTTDLAGNRLGAAWGEQGLVALVYQAEHDEQQQHVEEWEREPAHHWAAAPARLQYLAERVSSHVLMERLVTGAFWLTCEEPDSLEALRDERLELLRGYFDEPEAAFRGWGILPDVGPVAIQIERASRRRGRFYEIGDEQGEALLPPHWFRSPAEPKQGRGLLGDSITFDQIRMAVGRLAELGIIWPSALDLAKARGVEPEDD